MPPLETDEQRALAAWEVIRRRGWLVFSIDEPDGPQRQIVPVPDIVEAVLETDRIMRNSERRSDQKTA